MVFSLQGALPVFYSLMELKHQGKQTASYEKGIGKNPLKHFQLAVSKIKTKSPLTA